jgi:3',5'-cyclic AMP phosphodiesterase CpdA
VDKGVYPFAKVIGNVALIGVNSVMPWSRAKNPFGSNGRVGDGQLIRLREVLTSPLLAGKRKIVLIHHHFRKPPHKVRGSMPSVWAAMEGQTMKLRGKGKLRKLFAGAGVEAVLHGHVHEVGIDEREGIRYLNAGGSVVGEDTDALSYHGVTIDAEGVRIETGTVEVGREMGRIGGPLSVHAAA